MSHLGLKSDPELVKFFPNYGLYIGNNDDY